MRSKFSRIISGTMTWGEWGKQLSQKEMTDLIEATFGLGITSFDHADIYGGYTTEADFGAAFTQSTIPREKVTFISKCGIQYPSEMRPLAVKHYDYSADHIRFSVESSLRNLQTDYLDLLLLHRPSPLMDATTITTTLETLKKEGKIHDYGVSNFTPSQIQLLSSSAAIKWNQIQCSLTHTEALTNGELDFLQASDIGVMAWSPLGSYFKETNDAQTRIRPLLDQFQKKYSASEEQLLLAWLMQHPAGIHPVVGTTQTDRLRTALAAESLSLDLQDWFLLYEASRGHRVA